MRTTSRRRFKWVPLAVAVALVAAALIFRGPLAGLLMRAALPVLSIRNAWSATEVSNLRAELASTTAALADRNLLAKENSELRREAGRSGEVRRVLAGVLEHPPGVPYDTLLLDAGEDEGVAVGARVQSGSVEIGRIDAVYAHTSRATLYSAPGQSYQALVVTADTSIPVAVQGQGAGALSAEVPAGTKVAAGDDVVFPGVAGGFVASVSGVATPEGSSFSTIYLRVPTNVFELRFVYVTI